MFDYPSRSINFIRNALIGFGDCSRCMLGLDICNQGRTSFFILLQNFNNRISKGISILGQYNLAISSTAQVGEHQANRWQPQVYRVISLQPVPSQRIHLFAMLGKTKTSHRIKNAVNSFAARQYLKLPTRPNFSIKGRIFSR